MKKLLALPALVLMFCSCESTPDLTPAVERTFDPTVIMSQSLTEPYVISLEAGNLKEGQITEVKLNGEVLYRGNMPTVIDIPKYASATRGSEDLVVDFYVPEPEDEVDFYSSERKGILMFEDFPTGDNDYNDLVCEVIEFMTIESVRGKADTYTLDLDGTKFKALAAGNWIPLQFGFEIRDSKTGELIKEVIYAKNIKEESFGVGEGFVNTVNPNNNPKKIEGLTIDFPGFTSSRIEAIEVTTTNPLCFSWFIIDHDGTKFYTVDSSKFLKGNIYAEYAVDYNGVMTAKGVPYGIFVPGVTNRNFKWAAEGIALWDAYPALGDWFTGKDVNPFVEAVAENLYK